MNPHSEHAYGILSGDPMAYYLFSQKHERKVFFSTRYRPWGDLKKEPDIEDGYIYNRGKLKWHFSLNSLYKSLAALKTAGLERYVPPYRIGYESHERWFLLSNLQQLKSEYCNKLSEKIRGKNLVRLKRFKYYVRGDNEVKRLLTNQLNAAVCETSVQPPSKEDIEEIMWTPMQIVDNLIRTDIRQSKLHEETIERAYLLKLLIRGTYPTKHGDETVVWLTNQRVLERTRERYDVAFRLKESGRYVAVEFKRGEGADAIEQLKGYIKELRREHRTSVRCITQDSVRTEN